MGRMNVWKPSQIGVKKGILSATNSAAYMNPAIAKTHVCASEWSSSGMPVSHPKRMDKPTVRMVA